MWQVEIQVDDKSFTGKEYELNHAGSLSAIFVLQMIKKGLLVGVMYEV